MSEPKWLDLARREIGTKEIAGASDNPRIMQYYADAGFPDIDHDETAWCAAFVNAMLKRSGLVGTRSLAARSFETYGKKLAEPKVGAIAVFPRGSPKGWQGHVGIVAQIGENTVSLLGGNQADQVCFKVYAKDRAIAWRWPVMSEPKKASEPKTTPNLVNVSRKARTMNSVGNMLHAVWMSIAGLFTLENVGQANGAISDVKTFAEGLALPALAVLAICGVLLFRYLINKIKADYAEGRYIPSGS
jgi:uncharacterized protein (TIGR02594 family)